MPITLARQLASLLKGGVPLFQALTIIGNQLEGEREKQIVSYLRDEVKGGASLSEALKAYPNVTAWLRYAQTDHREAGPSAEFLLALTEENVVTQLRNLRSHPTVAARLEEGDLALHGWVYHIGTGTVTALSDESRKFVPVGHSK